MPMLEDELGRVLRTADMVEYTGLDVKTIRQYYAELGGIRLGKQYLFFEKEVINAIQKRSKMGSPGEDEKREEGENLSEQEGRIDMGKQCPVKSRVAMAREDKHGLLI
jgi:hypothetical protein